MMINTEEVNFLVYRYLEESGFHHSAYLFGYESSVITAGIDGTLIPRGALLSLLQKSVLFAEAEVFSLLTESDFDAKFGKAIGSMSLLECTTTDAAKLKAMERVKEDFSSRVCSPHPSTSASTAPTATATTTSASSATVTMAAPSAAAKKLPAGGVADGATDAPLDMPSASASTVPQSTRYGTANNNSNNNNNTNNGPAASSANGTTMSDSVFFGNVASTSYYTLTTTTMTPTATYAGSNGRSPQVQREREFRAQQSQPNPAGLPRGAVYRTTAAANDGKNSNLTSSPSSGGNASQHYYRPDTTAAAGGGVDAAAAAAAASLQYLNAANGLGTFVPPLLHHQQQQQQKEEFLGKNPVGPQQQQAQPQQQQSRYLMNGNHTIRKGQPAATVVGPAPPAASAATVTSGAGPGPGGPGGKSSVLTAPPASMFQFYKDNQ